MEVKTSYQTVKADGEETLIIKKSRFIGYASPASTEEAAMLFIEKIRKKHLDANHNCFAYLLGLHSPIQKASDDGEPSGTAGRPILEVLKKEGLTNVVVVVTRYFGGTLLGAGGLVRAYGQAATGAVHAAGIVTCSLFQTLAVKVDYPYLGKVENETLQAGYYIDRLDYAQEVTLFVLAPVAEVERYLTLVTDATNGQAQLELKEQIFAAIEGGKLIK